MDKILSHKLKLSWKTLQNIPFKFSRKDLGVVFLHRQEPVFELELIQTELFSEVEHVEPDFQGCCNLETKLPSHVSA